MKERLRNLLSEVGESFDYLRSDVRNLSRYMTELEKLVEGYRTLTSNAQFSTQAERVERGKLLKRTQKIIGPPKDARSPDNQETEQVVPAKSVWPAVLLPAGLLRKGKGTQC